MRSLRFPNAALLPRKHEGGNESGGTCFYGKKPNVYRVIYEVDEELQTVWVLTIRHGARRKVKASELV